MALRPITDFASQILKPYINNQDKAYAANIAPVETSPATSAHTAGTQIIYNGVLYDVTADINANDALATTGAGANIAAADDVSEQISNVKNALSDEVVTRSTLGAHNLFPIDWATIKARNTAGTWNGNVYTYEGAEFTVHDDFSVTVNRTTATSNQATFTLYQAAKIPTLKDGKTYNLVGCPSGGSSTTYLLYITQYYNGADHYVVDVGSGQSFDYVESSIVIACGIIIRANETVSNLTYKPMILMPTDSDPTYQPYAMTNRELTDALGMEIVASSTTPSITYRNRLNELAVAYNALPAEKKMRCIITEGSGFYQCYGNNRFSRLNVDPTQLYFMSYSLSTTESTAHKSEGGVITDLTNNTSVFALYLYAPKS